MTLGERIKKARKELDLTQQKFAEQIGTTQNNIASYEIGRREPSSAAINNICKTFSINETWLRTGEGEMFDKKSTNALEQLVHDRGLSDGDRLLIEKFLGLKPSERHAVLKYALSVAVEYSGHEVAPDALQRYPQEMSDDELHQELDRQLSEEEIAVADRSAFGRGKSGTVAG